MSQTRAALAFSLAAFAIAILVPSYSAAAPPECIFFGAGNGRYEDAGCSIRNAIQGNNGYSLTACILTPMGAIGAFSDSACTMPLLNGSYVESSCVNVRAGNGQYKDFGCSMVEAGGEWLLIFRRPRVGTQNNLQWAVDGVILLASTESDTATTAAKGNIAIKVPAKFTISCKTAKLVEDKIVGSASETAPGTTSGKIELGECQVEGKSECEINGKSGLSKEAKITTEALKGKLAYSTAVAAEKELAEISSETKADLLLKPATGTVFMKIKLGKGGCPEETTTSVEGEVLAKVLGTPEIDAEKHEIELLETGGTYWEDNSKKEAVSSTVTIMKGFSHEVGLTGKLELSLTGSKLWYITN